MSGRIAPKTTVIKPSADPIRVLFSKKEITRSALGKLKLLTHMINIIPRKKKTTPPNRCAFLFIIIVKNSV